MLEDRESGVEDLGGIQEEDGQNEIENVGEMQDASEEPLEDESGENLDRNGNLGDQVQYLLLEI